MLCVITVALWFGAGRAVAESRAQGVVIEPPRIFGAHKLIDQEGRPASFPASGWQLVFFGFTHCPDVCPMTLHKAVQALDKLGARASALKVIFITIDPQRDTPEAIKRYLAGHGAGMQGLTGTLPAVDAIGKEFEVVVRRYQDRDTAAYRFEHSAFLYLIDPQGRLVMFYPATVTAGGIAEDVTRLMAVGNKR